VQLLVYTDYALRILLYAGAHHPGPPVSAAEIAAAYRISADHVAKAAKTLTRQGWLRATRGAGGGVQLAKAPAEIRIGDVVRLFEAGRGPVACLQPGGDPCRVKPACRLRGLFERAEAAFYRELDGETLEGLLETRPRLVQLLAIR
jgi:Rrf2 family transcriptional regulator, nitric oxide-sensitive transcriptional repressor